MLFKRNINTKFLLALYHSKSILGPSSHIRPVKVKKGLKDSAIRLSTFGFLAINIKQSPALIPDGFFKLCIVILGPLFFTGDKDSC